MENVKHDVTQKPELDNIQEYLKCKTDPIYFIENYIKIFNQRMGVVPFKMFEKQKEFIRLWLEKHKMLVLKSRQTGMSTTLQALSLWLQLFYSRYYIGILSIEQEKANQFLQDIKEMYEISELSKIPWLPKLERPLKKSLHFSNGSIIRQGNTNNPFRSFRLSTVIVDEQQFVPNLEEQLKQLAPTLATIQNSGIPWGIILNSTPNGVDNDYYRYYEQQVNSDNPPYTLFKFHWRDIPYYDEEWYKQQCEILNNDHLAIMQELELHFISSNDTYLDSVTLERLQKSQQKPIGSIDINGWEVYIYEEVKENKQYIIGVDVASGMSNDQSQFVVIDEEGKVVQDFQSKHISDVEYQDVLVEIGKYYNTQSIQIEVTGGWGLQVARRLREKGYPNLFIDKYISSTKEEQKINTQELEKRSQTRTYGIITTAITRPLILKQMKEYVTEFPENIRSERIISELLVFVYRGGKPQAKHGHNDDLVMQLSFAYYQRNQLIEQNLINLKQSFEQIENSLLRINLKESRKIVNKQREIDNEIITDITNNNNSQQNNDFDWILKI